MRRMIGLLAWALVVRAALATETEHIGMQVLPAPGKVVVDGKTDDWDLSGGVLVCSDVENLRGQLACWFHLMHGRDGLYILARWTDHTPLNNPGSSKGDYGFAGDCLQVRVVTAPGQKDRERTAHLTAWRDRDGIDVVDVAYGKKFDQGGLKDAQAKGAVQEFQKNPDAKGYVQEIFMPWPLLCREGVVPKAGDRIGVTVEPNFCTEALFRITMKDVFKADVVPDRVFTFMSSQCWGTGTLEAKGNVPHRPIRLADGREFKVTMAEGVEAIDWSGLIQTRELKGFKTIAFAMPEDGYVSLNIRSADGTVARHLLNAAFMTRGRHEVKWDGLTTPNWRKPGQPVAAGTYAWDALWHKGIGLRLVGWAHNGGSAPWDGNAGKANWGGDHGIPFSAACDGQKVYLGWTGAEAGKAMVACDLDGKVQWRLSRGGMSGAELVTVDAGTVYAMNWDGQLFRVDTGRGGFTDWAGSGSTDLAVDKLVSAKLGEKEHANCLDARDGRVYVGYEKHDLVAVLDGKSGKLLKELKVPKPIDLEMGPDKTLYVVSGWTSVLAVNPETGATRPFATGFASVAGLALDGKGNVYLGLRDPDNQVRVYDPKGKLVKTLGRKGGRAPLGPWQPDGMRSIKGMAVDPRGQLWVMEADDKPKRVSVWSVETGRLVRELFGPTAYGALGGAINPKDPLVMVGHSCEWRLDPATGRARCLATITRKGMSNARFAVGSNGRLYLGIAGNWAFNVGPLEIHERLGDAQWRLRTVIYHADKDGKEMGPTGHGQTGKTQKTMVWADANDDGERQPSEIAGVGGELRFSAWYMGLTPDLTLYAGDRQFRVAGFTPCGAPRYDLAKPVKMPAKGLGSADGRLVLQGGDYGVDMTWLHCYDIASGKRVWSYPDNFNGVHGSHRAVPPEVGMIRGSFGPCGAARLPDPIGNAWVIATNVGEWHILTERGFYLTRLFQGNPMKMKFPESAAPGAILDNCPPGMGGEDFGGSIAATPDGQFYIQAGKTGFWNIRVVGLDTVKAMKGTTLTLSAEDVKLASRLREGYLQEAIGTKRLAIKKAAPALTGDFNKDFRGSQVIAYKKEDSAAVRSAAAWDDANLYLAWDVKDATPWVNGAEAPEFLYAHGDTVDFQLGTDPKADPKRGEPVLGDLRLSIGSFRGTPTAVLYRPKAADKAPKTFTSGVVRDGYVVESVTVVKDAKITVRIYGNRKGYVVEAVIPLAALGLKPAAGLTLRGDFGVTHGDRAGKDTVLRTHWHNQSTGIVNDEVFELKLEPRNWGEIRF